MGRAIGTLGQADFHIGDFGFYLEGDTRIGANPTLLRLYGATSGSSTNNGTFRKQDASTGYAPGAGRKFIALAIVCFFSNAASTASVISGTLQYTDNDLGITGASPTNSVLLGGTSLGRFSANNVAGDAAKPATFLVDFSVPATKFFGFTASGQSSGDKAVYFAYGYEVDA